MNTTPDGAQGSSVDQPGGASRNGAAAELGWEPATAYAIEGYEPNDPWNAVLCVEGRTTEIVLELTPTHLDRLVTGLTEVRDAQRTALGAGPAGDERDFEAEEKSRALGRVSHAARLATGSAPVSRLWNSGNKGRMVVIGGALLFVLLGVILSVVSQYR